MRARRIYKKDGDANLILCCCPECGHLAYVEEHGRDRCPKCREVRNTMEWDFDRCGWVYEVTGPYLENIPYNCRNMMGTHMVKRPSLERAAG